MRPLLVGRERLPERRPVVNPPLRTDETTRSLEKAVVTEDGRSGTFVGGRAPMIDLDDATRFRSHQRSALKLGTLTGDATICSNIRNRPGTF